MRIRCPSGSTIIDSPTNAGHAGRRRRGQARNRFRCPSTSFDTFRDPHATIREERTIRPHSRPSFNADLKGSVGRYVVNDPADDPEPSEGKPRKVYIGNLDLTMTPEELGQHINAAGPFLHLMMSAPLGLSCDISSLSASKHRSLQREIRRTVQYARVWYPSENAARTAVRYLSDVTVGGRRLKVSLKERVVIEAELRARNVKSLVSSATLEEPPCVANVGGRTIIGKARASWNSPTLDLHEKPQKRPQQIWEDLAEALAKE